jgi:zinc D-Ala-D-Ala carboxypeptidase
MTQMTKNFSLAELTKSETALRHGLENNPGDDELNNLLMLCANVLQPVRDHFGTGVKVNSGYRSPEVNVKVGGF